MPIPYHNQAKHYKHTHRVSLNFSFNGVCIGPNKSIPLFEMKTSNAAEQKTTGTGIKMPLMYH